MSECAYQMMEIIDEEKQTGEHVDLKTSSENTEVYESRTCWDRFLLVGPGLIVSFADCDGPGTITVAQSGAQFAYYLLLPQLVLIPVLFMAQELTVRLGLFAEKGLTRLLPEQIRLKGWYFWVCVVVFGIVGVFSLISAPLSIPGVIPGVSV